jgi:hypothetical protein
MVHIVEKGDTLYNISNRYMVSIHDIMKMNNIGKDFKIVLGQKLFIQKPEVSYVPSRELLISDFCITKDNLLQHIADSILQYHIRPIQTVEREMNIKVTCSMKSGYRTIEHEVLSGRGNGSQHTFSEKHQYGIGASDLTSTNIKKLIEGLIKHTNYRRIAYYPKQNFVHVDYKGNERIYFEAQGKEWKRIKAI